LSRNGAGRRSISSHAIDVVFLQADVRALILARCSSSLIPLCDGTTQKRGASVSTASPFGNGPASPLRQDAEALVAQVAEGGRSGELSSAQGSKRGRSGCCSWLGTGAKRSSLPRVTQNQHPWRSGWPNPAAPNTTLLHLLRERKYFRYLRQQRTLQTGTPRERSARVLAVSPNCPSGPRGSHQEKLKGKKGHPLRLLPLLSSSKDAERLDGKGRSYASGKPNKQ
jgi:hypothetical protein